jgi:hypothetical protein
MASAVLIEYTPVGPAYGGFTMPVSATITFVSAGMAELYMPSVFLVIVTTLFETVT